MDGTCSVDSEWSRIGSANGKSGRSPTR